MQQHHSTHLASTKRNGTCRSSGFVSNTTTAYGFTHSANNGNTNLSVTITVNQILRQRLLSVTILCKCSSSSFFSNNFTNGMIWNLESSGGRQHIWNLCFYSNAGQYSFNHYIIGYGKSRILHQHLMQCLL
jgi:hypothetical protein